MFLLQPRWLYVRALKGKPFIHFTLNTFGIENQIPYEFMKSYNELPPDNYIIESRIDHLPDDEFPTRSRRYAKLWVDVQRDDEYLITNTQTVVFENDSRSQKRVFEPIPEVHLSEPWLMKFVTQVTALSVANHNHSKEGQPIKSADVHLHQVRQTTYKGLDDQTGEGIHRSGADYIVSALVMNRYNVEGGESIITKDQQLIYKTILDDKEGLYQEGRQQKHYVTPISTYNEGLGFRDILGIDIILNT